MTAANAADGTHTITAIARDADGNITTSSPVTVTVDNNPPTVSLTAPASGASVSGNVSVSATASDNVGVVGVQFKLDGANLGAEDTSSPYSVSWNTTTVSNGSHTLTAVARDATGNTMTATNVTVTVSNTAPTDTLTSNQTLNAGQQLNSSSGGYHLDMQSDGNLVLYNSSNQALWHTFTYGTNANKLSLQSDGNLVLYNSANKPFWHTFTYGTNANKLQLKSDGTLVLTNSSANITLWQAPTKDTLTTNQTLTSGQQLTSVTGGYRLTMQSDGNLVIYNKTNQPIWNTFTYGTDANKLVMQPDGNLVLYNSANKPFWHTFTYGTNASRLVMQSDGNLVLYNSAGKYFWFSGTVGR